MKFAPPSKALHRGSWASVVSATADSTTSSEVVLQSALADQIALLQGCLVRVGSFLERAEVALSRLSLMPAMLQTAMTSHPPIVVGVCSEEDTEAKLYGCFSPRVGDISSSMFASLLSYVPLKTSPSPCSWLRCCKPCPRLGSYV